MEITRNHTHKHLGPKLFFQFRPKEASIVKLPFFKVSDFCIQSCLNIVMKLASIVMFSKNSIIYMNRGFK